MRRKLFTFAAVVSAVLCLAVCGLWVRSYRVADGWSWSDGRRVPTAGYQIAWRKILLARDGRVESICIHGDGPNAVELAAAVRAALEDAGIEVAPL